jgi:ubiquinone/menaquinone biosynthesis C-methylase UbiE
MSRPAPSTDALRQKTQAHYDEHPFGFDQEQILEEKLAHRIMGEAIRALAGRPALVMDVGCGACRVARLVQRTGRATTVGVDLSLASLRAAAAHRPGPLVNGDNLRLPFRSGVADLVVSNGVIHHTPDAHASFLELARVTKPGGTLVVSVYDKRSWYYPVYRYGGAAVRALRRVIGDTGLKLTVFPPFHLAILGLMAVVRRRPFWIPIDIGWNLFHDQFTTPVCTFHTTEEMAAWAREAGLVTEEERSEAARQLITFRLRKPARG